MKYQVSRVVAGPFLRLLGRPEITGEEHIPRAGGAIRSIRQFGYLAARRSRGEP